MVDTGSAINALWAATLIESFETTNLKMSESRQWGRASIISDSVLKIVEETPEKLNGNAVVDEDYLKSWVVVDFSHDRCYRASQSRSGHRKFERNRLSLVVKGYHRVCMRGCELCFQPFIPLVFYFKELMLHRNTLKSLVVTVVSWRMDIAESNDYFEHISSF